MTHKVMTLALIASAFGMSACNREASGQVVAIVNGQEVSLTELNGELKAAGAQANAGGDQKAIRAAALQRLVDRKLLVQQAKERGLDKDPEFLQQQIRANDELLIQLFGKQVTSNLAIPTQTEADAFMNANPSAFARRTIYEVDQIGFPAPADRSRLKVLEGDHDMPAVIASLNRLGIKFGRRRDTIDAARLPVELSRQIAALPPGEPFVLGAGNQIIINTIVNRREVPLDAAASRAIAVESLRRKEVSDVAQKQLKQARDAAKIEYQPGFAPPAAAKGGTPAAGAAKT